MKIERNVSLASYTTFHLGGKANYFIRIKNKEDLQQATNFAKQNSLPVFILGGGSNLLVADNGFAGLVLKNEIKGVVIDVLSEVVELKVGAGEVWDELVEKTIQACWGGLENLSAIPGTVGAGVVQNIGAFGKELSDFLAEVKAFDLEKQTEVIFTKNDCALDYRQSFFKTPVGKNFVITQVTLHLPKKYSPDISFAGLAEEIAEQKINSQNIRQAVLRIRNRRYPDSNKIGSAGCFFKNAIVSQKEMERLKNEFPYLPIFKKDAGRYKISVGWLLDKFGWKGRRWGGVGVSDQHVLLLVNYGGGSTKQVLHLAEKISQDFFQRTKIKIEKEIVFLK